MADPSPRTRWPHCSPSIDAGMFDGDDPFDQRREPYRASTARQPTIGAFELQLDAVHLFGDGFERSPCS